MCQMKNVLRLKIILVGQTIHCKVVVWLVLVLAFVWFCTSLKINRGSRKIAYSTLSTIDLEALDPLHVWKLIIDLRNKVLLSCLIFVL
ncbi:hypothetical protein Fmac_019356 [Flemingia macrophylla]|uniref:Transmembrane protein n=1 Tax=Flemingia macrophylla TaxID=520843 RepID=A0ABD1M9I4_9FABA